MARLPRLSVGGLPHLVLQAGHNGQAVFLDAVDRAAYRSALKSAAAETGVRVHAYSLDSGRVLLLVTPAQAQGLSRMMQRVGRVYTAAFNRRHLRSGTIWAGRFRATVIDPDSGLVDAMRHVEAEAARADDAAAPPAERISSLAHHLGLENDAIVSDHPLFWALGNTPFERHAAYRALVNQPLPAERRLRFDDAVQKGWAVGPEAFLDRLSGTGVRRVRPLAPGRPRRAAGRKESVPN